MGGHTTPPATAAKRRVRIAGRATKILLGALFAVALAFALFDWNWLRGPFERYLSKESHREVKIGALDVALGLNPTIRMRGLHVQNASWADSRPLIDAAEAAFTFSLASLWDELTVVSLIVLRDADVNLERQADGLRNWRLIDPQYRGPPQVKVLAFEAHRTKLRFVNRGIDLELATAASDLPPDATGGNGDPGLTTRITFSGRFQAARFSGAATSSARLTIRDSRETFPLRGHLLWNGTRMDVDGAVADLLQLSAFDVRVRLAGPSLASLHPFPRARLPATHAYRLEGQLKRPAPGTTSARLQGKIGNSDVAGDGSYSRLEPRPMLRAAVRSESLDFADIHVAAGATPADAGRIFPARKLDAAGLLANDAQITLEAKQFKATDTLLLDNLRLTAVLDAGVLQLKPLAFGMAGGSVSGAATVDAREGRLASRVSAEFHKLRLERLFPESALKARGAGLIDAQLRLTGQGESIAALFGGASGAFDARMERGRISNLADAKLALNGGKILALMLRGDRDIDILCAAVGVDFRNGEGRTRVLAIDTEQTRTHGTGRVDLRAERFDAVLTPHPKKPGMLSLGNAVRIEGSFRTARLTIARSGDESAPALDSPGCTASASRQ